MLKNPAELSQLPCEARAATPAPLKNTSGDSFLKHPQPTKGQVMENSHALKDAAGQVQCILGQVQAALPKFPSHSI